MHRAEQIVDAIVARFKAQADIGVNPANIFANRSLSLGDDQGEIPAITVNFGDDERDDFSQAGAIWSDLEIEIALFNRAPEDQIKHLLLEMREKVEYALAIDQNIGLAFVLQMKWENAIKPKIDSSSELTAGEVTVNYRVKYAQDQLRRGF